MRIMIPVDEEKEKVCVSFGRTPFFLIYDSETKEQSYVDNPAAEVQGGAGIKAAQCVVDNHADVLVTIRCGENAAQVFNVANIKVYKGHHEEASKVLQDFLDGNLEELTYFHPGFQGIR